MSSLRMNNLSQPSGFQMPDMATVQPMSGYQLPSGGPNLGQPIPTAGQPLPMSPPMSIPTGGPNTGAPTSDPFAKISMSGYTPPPMDAATAIACGIPPSQVSQVMNPNSSAFGPTQAPTIGGFMDIFNRPSINFGMAPSTPNSVDQGLGGQQMDFGNQMGGMNNWFSNFSAPRPMPAPAPADPAPMMPMKGMFGVR